MKKLCVGLVFVMIILLCSCNITDGEKVTTEATANSETAPISKCGELRAVWLSYNEIAALSGDTAEKQYRESVAEMVEKLCSAGFNTVFFQARAFSDALYNSNVFPASKYGAEISGGNAAYDVLGIFIEYAKKAGIDVHAWINPFRVSYSTDFSLLPDGNPAKKLYNEDKNTDALIVCEKGIYYNPASPVSRKIIISGIREVIEKYDIAGIHFDDYFYPEVSVYGDEDVYAVYKKAGGTLTADEWRRGNINEFISFVNILCKSIKDGVSFGISTSANIEHNREKLFADVKRWCDEGLVDYIMPQIYFGFNNETKPFIDTAKEWEILTAGTNVALYCGLAAYKCGKADDNAGAGKDEWTENSDLLKRQYLYISENKGWKGFALFSYSYAFGENMNDISNLEISNLLTVIN